MQSLTDETPEGSTRRRFRTSPAAALRIVEVAILGAIIVLPLVVRDQASVERFGGYLLLAVFAISVDLIWGYGGMLTFGHAVFFGGGAYVVAILTTRDAGFLPLPYWVAFIAAIGAAAILALAMGFFVFSGRLALRGVEFAVVTLAVAVMAERLADAGGAVTGGRNGILMDARLGIPGLFSFHKGLGFYVFAALVLVATYLAVRRFVASRTGLVLRGIRENEDRVDLLGYDVPRVKRLVFALSAMIAAGAGSLFYTQLGIVAPAAVGVAASTSVLLWVALGGRGTLLGPIVGAMVLPYLNNTLSSGRLLDTWLVIVGVLLVVVILVLPAGIFGFLNRGSDE